MRSVIQIREIAVSLTVVGACLLAFGESVVTWTGAAGDNEFYTAENWSPSAPGELTTVRFTNDVWLTASGEPTIKYGHGGKWLVEDGAHVYFAKGSGHYVCGAIVDVAKDSLLVVSNAFNPWNTRTFYKNGEGTLRMAGAIMTYATGGWHTLDITGGKLEFVPGAGGSMSGVGTYCSNVFVRAGAELSYVGTPSAHPAAMAVHLETNAVLRLNGFVKKNISAFSGEGRVIAEGDVDSYVYCDLAKTAEPPFYGTFSGNMILDFTEGYGAGDSPRFVVHRPDALRDIISVNGPGAIIYGKGMTGIEFTADGKKNGYLRLMDEDGGPVAVDLSITNASSLTYVGSGELAYRSLAGLDKNGNPVWDTFGCNNLLFTGTFVAGTNSYVELGNNAGTGTSLDLTGNGNIKGIGLKDWAHVRFSAPDADVVAVPVTGWGEIGTFNAKRTFSDFRMDPGSKLILYKDVEIAGGDGHLGVINAGTKTARLTVSGGRLSADESVGRNSVGRLPTPDGVLIEASINAGPVAVSGGEFAWSHGNGVTEFEMTGGRTWFTMSNPYNTVSRFVFNGGEAVLDGKNVAENERFTYLRPQSSSTNWVGAAGARLRAVNLSGIRTRLACYSGVLPEDGTSGELSFYGSTTWLLDKALMLNGPVFVKDGNFEIGTNALVSATPHSFGTGEFRLGNGILTFCSDWTSIVTPPALQFYSLAYGGASVVRFRNYDNSPVASFCAQHVKAGALRRMGKGSVLFLRENVSGTENCLGETGRSSFKVTNGLANDGDLGFVREPIVVVGNFLNHFATYDADAGVKALAESTYVVNDFAETTADDLVKVTGSIWCDKTDAYAAGIRQAESYNSVFNISGNSTLHLGDGTNPAMFLFYVNTGVSGGTIDFGTSEGIFVAALSNDGDKFNSVNSRLTGSGGVSYVGYCYENSTRKIVKIGKANAYAGGTWVNGCAVAPLDAAAFSAGAVTVGAGEVRGGRILFMEPLTFANAFSVGGWGVGSGDNTSGCLVFAANGVTLTGSVAITEDARIGVNSGVRATISGTVSGKRLIAIGGGTLALAGANTHDSTEAYGATVAVSSDAALGAGEIALNDGTIRFENAGALTVTNLMRGAGTVQMAGGGEVKFRGDLSRLDSSTVLDIPGTSVTLTEQPPFDTITNSRSRAAKLTLGGTEDYVIDPSKFSGSFDLTLASGATLDIGGGTLTVRRFDGDRAAVNGTIEETFPKSGLLLIVR